MLKDKSNDSSNGSIELACNRLSLVQVGTDLLCIVCYKHTLRDLNTSTVNDIYIQYLLTITTTTSTMIMTTAIRPLSGTSSFSNDTVCFTNFFVYDSDRICLSESIILGGIKI